MAKPLLADELWEVIEPLLPAPAPKPKGGRPPLENRAALTGVLFVLKTLARVGPPEIQPRSQPALAEGAFGAVPSTEHSIRKRLLAPYLIEMIMGGAGNERATYGYVSRRSAN